MLGVYFVLIAFLFIIRAYYSVMCLFYTFRRICQAVNLAHTKTHRQKTASHIHDAQRLLDRHIIFPEYPQAATVCSYTHSSMQHTIVSRCLLPPRNLHSVKYSLHVNSLMGKINLAYLLCQRTVKPACFYDIFNRLSSL